MDRYPGQQEGCGVNMPKIMQPGMREELARFLLGLIARPDQIGHQRRHHIRMDWLTPTGREHVIIGAPPVGADRQLLGGLAGTVLPEDLHRTGVDADSTQSAGLGRALDPRPAHNGSRAGDAYLMSSE